VKPPPPIIVKISHYCLVFVHYWSNCSQNLIFEYQKYPKKSKFIMLNLCDSKRIYVYNFVITATVVLGDQKVGI